MTYLDLSGATFPATFTGFSTIYHHENQGNLFWCMIFNNRKVIDLKLDASHRLFEEERTGTEFNL